jgi:hypothetical protein
MEAAMSLNHHNERPSSATETAIWLFAGVAFLTTTAGVFSLASPGDRGPMTAALWLAVAALLAGGLSTGIASLALTLYARVSLPAFLAAMALAMIAALFDASFYQQEYAPQLEASVHDRLDEEYRRKESDRLASEMASSIASVRRQTEPQRLEALQGEREAKQGARYEEKLRPEEPMRYCGPICNEHLRQAERYHAQLDELQRVDVLLKDAPTVPSSDDWRDLERFHAEMLRVLRQLPLQVALPAAPSKPRLVTTGGNAVGIGGLGVMVEMLLAGNFKDVKLVVPLALALVSELCVILLVLGTRPWRPVRVWLWEKVEHAEETIDRANAEARTQRRARNRRRQEQETVEQELRELHSEAVLRSNAARSWTGHEEHGSANGNGHHRHGMEDNVVEEPQTPEGGVQ